MDIQRDRIRTLIFRSIFWDQSKTAQYISAIILCFSKSVSIDEALELLSSQKELKSLKKALANVYGKILEGESLHSSFEKE